MTIAALYPARTDSNGNTWYLTGTGKLDGWTANIEMAHPSYRTGEHVTLTTNHLEKIRARLDFEYEKWMGEDDESEANEREAKIDGMCICLGILTNTKTGLHWDSAEARYEDRKRQGEKNGL